MNVNMTSFVINHPNMYKSDVLNIGVNGFPLFNLISSILKIAPAGADRNSRVTQLKLVYLF